MIQERAFAKLNLILHVGRPRADGLHPLCSIFASLDLADDVRVTPSRADSVECAGVAPDQNLAGAAVVAFRERVPSLPSLAVQIEKRIPVAAGLGGGSADAAAVLRAANRLAGGPFDSDGLRQIGAGLGSDVPSQVEPRHMLVQGVGERVEPIALPGLSAVLVPQREGLSTARVYRQFDLIGRWRERLDPEPLRRCAAMAPQPLGAALENDLQPATLELRPELEGVLDSLRRAGALGALVSGSGPTCFGLFADRGDAEPAAAGLDDALVTELRPG